MIYFAYMVIVFTVWILPDNLGQSNHKNVIWFGDEDARGEINPSPYYNLWLIYKQMKQT